MNSNVFHVYKLKIKSLLFTIVTAYSKIYIYYNINDNYTIIPICISKYILTLILLLKQKWVRYFYLL